jgi:2-methylfumaryl-CoA hydratase
MAIKTNLGNFFEDFLIGQEIVHATPRTVTKGDVSLYSALYGMRFAIHSSDAFAADLGLDSAPIDDLLVFHLVFGKTVADISLNAVANLGYAGGVFGVPVHPGDTLSASSTVIGLKENSTRKTGVVYVRSVGRNQLGETVLDYLRWVMVRKREPKAAAAETVVPKLPGTVGVLDLRVPDSLNLSNYDRMAAGSEHLWDDYKVGEKIDHVDGVTIEEAEHMMATRLYQNTAKVHFNQHTEQYGHFGQRLVYGGHIISLARSLSFNGLANAFKIAAINGGVHTAPAFAGDTIYAWSEILEKIELPERADLGALKSEPAAGFSLKTGGGRYADPVLLNFDYTILMPR